MPENLPTAPPEPTLEESEILDDSEKLPSLDESVLDETPAETPTAAEPEALPPMEEDLNWDESDMTVAAPQPVEEDLSIVEEPAAAASEGPPLLPIGEPEEPQGRSSDMSWEEGVDEVKEGMPFTEIEPPRVYAEEVPVTTEE
ncbi:MAG: hypothetical protein ACXAEF_15450, partial [Candidatus Thorarchaeota archaeon]